MQLPPLHLVSCWPSKQFAWSTGPETSVLMGLLADAALAAGGSVIGVIPQMLVDRGTGSSRAPICGSSPPCTRGEKAAHGRPGPGVRRPPGGLGTYEELFEVLTWGQLGIDAKPVACLNIAGYFDPLERMLDHAVAEGFLRLEQRKLLIVADDGEKLLAQLEERANAGKEWSGREVI